MRFLKAPTAGLVALAMLVAPNAWTAPQPEARVLVLPPTSVAGESRRLATVHSLLLQKLEQLDGYQSVPAKESEAAIKASRRERPEGCIGDRACLADLGKATNAAVVIAAEVAELGGDLVVYLDATATGGPKSLGSTTLVLGIDAKANAQLATAALVRLLEPSRYTGNLALAIDVPGAHVYLDGRLLGKSPLPTYAVSVGTHALRVTHPQYRDFVRFVDVSFTGTTKLDVPLTAFPVVTSDMIAGARGQAGEKRWYQSGWTVAGVGVVTLVATALIVALATDGVDADRKVDVH